MSETLLVCDTMADITKTAPKDGETTSSVAVLNTVLELFRDCSVYETHCELADTVVTILRDKVRAPTPLLNATQLTCF